MWKPSPPALKLNEWRRMLVSLPDFSIRDLFIPLGITRWIGQAVPPRYLFPLSFRDAAALPFVAPPCTGLIGAGYFLSPPRGDTFISAVNRTRAFSFSGLM